MKESTPTSSILTSLICLFFLLFLPFRPIYFIVPAILFITAIYFSIKNYQYLSWQQVPKENKYFIFTILFYIALFVISLIYHQGKLREIDSISRILLILPLLFLTTQIPFKQKWIVISILLSGISVGCLALIQTSLSDDLPFPNHMHIQAGGFTMSFALFCLAITCYAIYHHLGKWVVIGVIAILFALLASFMTTSRGAWLGIGVVPVILFCYRQILSKKLIIGLMAIAIISGILASDILIKRWQQAHDDITQYAQKDNGSTSVGARFDMWKSALLGIQEKPILGWGKEGVLEMRKKHYEQGLISEFASQFGHAHNQYLHDASTRGIIGLTALLGIFLVPLGIFIRGIKQSVVGSFAHLWSVMGVSHILAVMIYCLPQSFFNHNSGLNFYFFITVLFMGLYQAAKKQKM
ncbi:O-antigen ligase family protein [Pelistega sp. NLN82]|uniref:O-antigen ligase family protein n=1 Tax=Pelistega ratti TaxID=2652177 RepID=A0A6L9Y4E5_9BURK|nr:O-antigen ligase [Pelistega ratti]NEN75096.1 O-antigen ligase family protein [Pelistega ratti]